MPDQNGAVPTPTSVEDPKSSYLGTCPGILRLFTCILGLGAIILASVGSPNDLSSFSGDNQFQTPDQDFYGYGLGYAQAEPLNAIYIALLVIAWILSLGFMIVIFTKTYGNAPKWNRALYLIIGIVAWIAAICGAVGTFYFWGGCCHVFLPVRGENYLRYHYEMNQGYQDWCLCTLGVMRGSQYMYREAFRWRSDYTSLEIFSAWPHHFVVHILSVVCTGLFGILCFVACCFP